MEEGRECLQVTSLSHTPSVRLEERLHHLMEVLVGVKNLDTLDTVGPAISRYFHNVK